MRAQDVLDEREMEKTPSITTVSTEDEEEREKKKEDGVNVQVLAVVV